jgi:hypothetical protein
VVELFDLEGVCLAQGYERVVYGDHGPYVELATHHVQVWIHGVRFAFKAIRR